MRSQRSFRPTPPDHLEPRRVPSHGGASLAARHRHPAAEVAHHGNLGADPGVGFLSPLGLGAGRGRLGRGSALFGGQAIGTFLPLFVGPTSRFRLSTPFANNFVAGGASTVPTSGAAVFLTGTGALGALPGFGGLRGLGGSGFNGRAIGTFLPLFVGPTSNFRLSTPFANNFVAGGATNIPTSGAAVFLTGNAAF